MDQIGKSFTLKRIVIVGFLFISISVSATGQNRKGKVPSAKEETQKRSSQDSNGIQVMPMNPDFPGEELQKDGYLVHPYERKFEGNPSRELPDPLVRDHLLIQAGLEKIIFKWDQLDRDMLYMRARAMSVKDLQSRYPKLPSPTLEKLKVLIRQSEGS